MEMMYAVVMICHLVSSPPSHEPDCTERRAIYVNISPPIFDPGDVQDCQDAAYDWLHQNWYAIPGIEHEGVEYKVTVSCRTKVVDEPA